MTEEVYNDIMLNVTSTCEACGWDKCQEDLCPIWCIEQICEENYNTKEDK